MERLVTILSMENGATTDATVGNSTEPRSWIQDFHRV
jgi:hypothetical protein